MNYLDIFIIAILVIGFIVGARKGLIVSILSIVSLIATLVLSFSFTGKLSELILKYTPIESAISSVVSERLNALDPLTVSIIDKLKIAGMSPGEFLTIRFVNIAAFIVLFLVITVIMSFIKGGIKKTIKSSFLGPIDSVLGGVLGFITWGLVIMVVFAFITPVIPLLDSGNQFYTLINGSVISKYLIDHNFIIILIKEFIEGKIKGLITI